MGAAVLRAGGIGDEDAGSPADSTEGAEWLDARAVRADDDLIEALSAGLVPPPSGPRDPSDVEGELVALLAGWVADIRPETLLHPPGPRPAVVGLWTPQAGQPAVDGVGVRMPGTGIPSPRIPTTKLPSTPASPEPIASTAGPERGAGPRDTESPTADTTADTTADITADTTADTAAATTRIPLTRRPSAPRTAPANPATTPHPATRVATPDAADVTAPIAAATVRALLRHGPGVANHTRPALTAVSVVEDPTEPIPLAIRRAGRIRPYLARAVAAVMILGLITSGVLVRSYAAQPGETLWPVAQMVFPAKSRSVAAAVTLSTTLNTARVALQTGRLGDARDAYQSVQAQLDAVDDADGRTELSEQVRYLGAQLDTTPATAARPGDVSPVSALGKLRPLAVGQAGAVIQSGPGTTPGATQALATTPAAPPGPATPPVGPATGSSSGSPPVGPGGSTVLAGPPPAAPVPPAATTTTTAAPAGPTSSSSSTGSGGEPVAGEPITSAASSPPTTTTAPDPGPPVPPPPPPPPPPTSTTEPPVSSSPPPSTVVDSVSTDGSDATSTSSQSESVTTSGNTASQSEARSDAAQSSASTTSANGDVAIVGNAGGTVVTSAVASTNSPS